MTEWPFLSWSPDDAAAAVYDVTVDGAWEQLVAFYAGGASCPPLERVVALAREHGVRSLVVEQRQLDPDWRSEHAAFHGRLFRRHPSVTHRWHLFTTEVDPADVTALDPSSYRGYTTLRPLPATPVGPTMIAPPPGLDGGVRCEATERVSLFGTALTVRAMPFLSQDAEYLRCAHATLWMVLRHAHLAHGIPRRLSAEVHDAALGGVIVGRQVPSEGLSVQQMMSGATRLGLSPGLVHLPQTRAEDDDAGMLTLGGILCRYVNSQAPPVVISRAHAWVVVGYRRVSAAPGAGVRLWRHDDARGPYLEVTDPFDEPDEAHRPWQAALLPLLPQVYVTAERAEAAGEHWFRGYLSQADPDEPIAGADLTWRTYVTRSDEWLEDLDARGLDPALVRLYRLTLMPEYVWVVEAVDRGARARGEPDVVGEAVLDSTASTHHEPLLSGLIALHGGRIAHRVGPDHGQRREVRIEAPGHYPTGRRGRA
ncbi:hypothetical protein [Actinomycetospora termitidis]|uniref:Uncharacterized protein n=1 Tax=Actinomycetospora termitidis TaxID=3053470 RepID=A0ABT7M3P8_9PSEU|nr:hypothetical protein [Actinomycetospora sp. Odt1-22]MDL5155289.1 hypothetical protein [Actinomycetospora sp. Odt1-22]